MVGIPTMGYRLSCNPNQIAGTAVTHHTLKLGHHTTQPAWLLEGTRTFTSPLPFQSSHTPRTGWYGISLSYPPAWQVGIGGGAEERDYIHHTRGDISAILLTICPQWTTNSLRTLPTISPLHHFLLDTYPYYIYNIAIYSDIAISSYIYIYSYI